MIAYRELLLGCGYSRRRIVDPCMYKSPTEHVNSPERWTRVTAVDINPRCKPDYIMDLEKGLQTLQRPSPADASLFHQVTEVYILNDDTFDEIHAYEVLEHLGHQGNVTEFFGDFDELWRVLKPGGWLCATVPSRYSEWLWGDPGHRRVVLPKMLQFLNRPAYEVELGRTSLSDYRDLFASDWDIVYSFDNEETHTFVLQAVKPARVTA